MTWALRVPIGGNAKVVLLGLANHAHPDGTEAYPALDTLAEYAACDRSTARRNVRKLVADGWAIEDGLGPKGQTKYRLALERVPPPRGGGKVPPVQNATGSTGASQGGGTGATRTVPSEPSLGEEGARDPRDSAPDDFPDELRPHAREVLRILRAVAEQHGARKVWPLAVGRVVMAHPRHPLVASAHALAAWAADPPRPIRDVVGTYRTFLQRERELEAAEHLAADGVPASRPSGSPAGVTHLASSRADRERAKAERTERRMAVMRGEG